MPKHRDIDPRAKRRNRLDHVAQDGTAYVDGTIERTTSKAATKAYREGWERVFGKKHKRGGCACGTWTVDHGPECKPSEKSR